jgi:hypothetical protein
VTVGDNKKCLLIEIGIVIFLNWVVLIHFVALFFDNIIASFNQTTATKII